MRAPGLPWPRSKLGQWVGACGVRLRSLVDALRDELLKHGVRHADETPVQMRDPGKKKMFRAYRRACCPTNFEAIRGMVYGFAPSHAGEDARSFLKDWNGKIVCDDDSGYKASVGAGVTEIACVAQMP